MSNRRLAERDRRKVEGHDPVAIAGWAAQDERTAEGYPWDHRANASASSARHDREWPSSPATGTRLALASAVLAHPVRNDVGPGTGRSLCMGQRTPQACA